MEKDKFQDLIQKFELKNDITKNPNIWVGHAKIGYNNQPTIYEAKKILLEFFDEFIEEYEPTPEEIKNIIRRWENFHPYQNVREQDQPMFISKTGNRIIVAVIWPWQLKQDVASLMVYEGELS